MGGMVTVLEKEEYEAWLRRESQPTGRPASEGEDLFTALACATCHTGEDTERGPSLHGVFGAEVELASGATVRVDEQYLRESILDPLRQLRRGYQPLMPTFAGQVSEEQVAGLVRYIRELRPAPGGEAPAEAASAGG
jgi:cytochrome c oxidase subunit 2